MHANLVYDNGLESIGMKLPQSIGSSKSLIGGNCHIGETRSDVACALFDFD